MPVCPSPIPPPRRCAPTGDAGRQRAGRLRARFWRHVQPLLLALLLLQALPARAQEQTATPADPLAVPTLEPASPAATANPAAESTAAPAAEPVATPELAATPEAAATPEPALTETPPLTATVPATASPPVTTPATGAATPSQAARIEEILAGMTAADRVGQLFVVTFRGADTSFESAIAELIYAYRVGGVVLGPEHGNFSNEPGGDTARQVAVLTNKLQGLAYGVLLPDEQALQPVPNEPWPPSNLVSLEREIGVAPPNLPLLVGVEQLGDNLPGTALRRGFSPLPSQLAIGSTWDLETAQLVGATVGRELRAVGVNLLLGPVLDVVDVPRSDEVGSLSVHSFGGNPNWVGRMGRAYISGVHAGSSGRVATVARHFPGQGDIDRLPDAEVATIQRTTAELEQIALPPFLAVTRPQAAPQPTNQAATGVALTTAGAATAAGAVLTANAGLTAPAALTATSAPTAIGAPTASAPLTAGASLTSTVGAPAPLLTAATPQPAYLPLLEDPALTDVVMTSQMRYAALQPAGAPVAPLGLAPELPGLLAAQLGGWRAGGGLVMSGPLGVPAIRRSYAPALDDFPARRVALDAFMAGNDLLFLNRFALNEEWEQQLDNYRAVIAFFQERYRADSDFAARVDDAVRRILQLKLRLYERGEPAPGRPRLPAVPLSQLLVQEADLFVLRGAQPDGATPAAATAPLTASTATTAPAAAATVAATDTATPAGPLSATPAPDATPAAPGTAAPGTAAASALGAAAGVSSVAPAQAGAAPTAPLALAALQTARKALTMLFPDPAGAPPPPTPEAGDKIVIISDSRLQRECPTCTTEAAIDPDAIARIIISLYGPEATGQINPDDLRSLTFGELTQLLPAETEASPTGTPSLLPTPTPTPLLPEGQEPASALLEGDGAPVLAGTPAAQEADAASLQSASDLAEADWLIFALLDPNSAFAGSNALRRYLRLASDQVAEKRVVVFALNAPSFLDATEISKLTLYLGAYSKAQPFIESAVRALFRSLTPEGAPAVSVPGTRFASLAERLTPDAALTLPLRIENAGGLLVANDAALASTTAAGGALPAAAEASEAGPAVVNVGDTVQVLVGPVLDANGRPVPDGTVVNFLADFEGAELAIAVQPALTLNGRALRELVLERSGVLRIAATAGAGSAADTGVAASSGDPVILNVLEPLNAGDGGSAEESAAATEGAQGVQSAGENGAPEAAPPPADAGLTLSPTATLTASAGEGSGGLNGGDGERVNLLTLLLSLITMVLTLSMLLLAQIRVLPRETLFKSLLWAFITGLAAYLAYGLGWLPGSQSIADALNALGAPLVVFAAMLLPLFWLQLRPGGER